MWAHVSPFRWGLFVPFHNRPFSPAYAYSPARHTPQTPLPLWGLLSCSNPMSLCSLSAPPRVCHVLLCIHGFLVLQKAGVSWQHALTTPGFGMLTTQPLLALSAWTVHHVLLCVYEFTAKYDPKNVLKIIRSPGRYIVDASNSNNYILSHATN